MITISQATYSKLVNYPAADERGQQMYLLPVDTETLDYGLIPAESLYKDICAHLGVKYRDEVCIVWEVNEEWEVEDATPYFAPGWSKMPSTGQYVQKGQVSLNGKLVPAVAFQNASPVAFYMAAKDLLGLRNNNPHFA